MQQWFGFMREQSRQGAGAAHAVPLVAQPAGGQRDRVFGGYPDSAIRQPTGAQRTPTEAPKRVVQHAVAEAEHLATARRRLELAMTNRLLTEQRRLDELRSRPVLRDPVASLAGHYDRLGQTRERLGRAIATRLREESLGLTHTIERVRGLSPRATLQRGYAILADAEGNTVDRVATARAGQELSARLADGRLDLTVTNLHQEQL